MHARTHSEPLIEHALLPDATFWMQNCVFGCTQLPLRHMPELPVVDTLLSQYELSGSSELPGQYGSDPVQYALP